MNWQKDFTTNFMTTLNRLEKNQLCCLKALQKVYTQNSSSVIFSGDGTPNNPLTAISSGGGSGFFADPSSLVGLSPVNGTAITLMRSDAAPALNQSITPTWTGNHAFKNSSGINTLTFSGTVNLIEFNNSTNSIGYGLLVSDATNTRIGSQIATPLLLRTNSIDRVIINSSGSVLISDLAGTGNRMVITDATGILSTQVIPTNNLPANPTASIGLTSVNGSASTFMRSDAAPAINQNITPTWTAKHKWSVTSNNPAISLADAGYIEWRDSSDALIGTISGSKSIPYMTINNQSTGDFGIFSGTTFKFIVSTAGVITINNLSGTGNRMVIADTSGTLSTQTISTGFFASNSTNNINNTNPGGVGIGVSITNPTAYLHITGGTTVFPSLRFSPGSILTAPNDGAMEYDGTNLYFTIGTIRKVFPLGTSNNTIYTGDGSILGTRAIDVQNFSITWNNTGLFRIIKGDATIGGTYDFNSGVNFLSFDATNSSNLILDPITGLTFQYVNLTGPTVISSLSVNTNGISAKGTLSLTNYGTGANTGIGLYSLSVTSAGLVVENILPKRYVSLITQTGTSNPTVSVLENTLGGTVVWTRTGLGEYTATLTGVFTNAKTVIFVGPISDLTNLGPIMSAFRADANTIVLKQNQITAVNPATLVPIDEFEDISFEIRVYP